MNSFSDTFDYFVDDILASDIDLLKGELDFLLIQHIFNSIDLKNIKTTNFHNIDSIAAWYMMNFLYEKFWVPFFGGILSKFVFLIEGKKQFIKKRK